MPIRIKMSSEASGMLIKIDGRFRVEDIDDFVRIIEQLDGPAALDLTELRSVDRAAAVMVRDLIASGVELRAASPYVDLLLKAEPQTDPNRSLRKPFFWRPPSRNRNSMDG